MSEGGMATPQLRNGSHRRLAGGRPLETKPAGRACAHAQCETRLSRYNPSAVCARHHGWQDTAVRSQAP